MCPAQKYKTTFTFQMEKFIFVGFSFPFYFASF